MKASLLKLQKFLKLEAERNYDNRAVVGGLERILEPWQAEAAADGLPQELMTAVVTRLRDYANLSPGSRAEALEGLWRRVQREAGHDPRPPWHPPLPRRPPRLPQPPPPAKRRRNNQRLSSHQPLSLLKAAPLNSRPRRGPSQPLHPKGLLPR